MGDITDEIDFVVVTDLSPEGAKLVAPAPLEVGSQVALTMPMLEPLDVQIVWVSHRLAGCRFLDPLHPAVLRVLLAAHRPVTLAARQLHPAVLRVLLAAAEA